MMLKDNRRTAEISECGTYRYRLSRTWDTERETVAFVMLNPSTADATDDDPTLTRCINYAKDWGYGSLVVANLFALRSTSPDNLARHPDPVGPENDRYLRAVCDEAETVVAAWGTDGDLYDRESEVADLLDGDLYALDTTKQGHPNHPLYQPKDAEPTRWRVSEKADKEDG